MLVLKIAAGIVLGAVVLIAGCAVVVGLALNSNEETKALMTGSTSDVTVHIRSNVTSLPFEGSLGSGPNQRSVGGTTPGRLGISGEGSSGIFVAVIQKKDGGAATLEVELQGCPDGQKHIQSTNAPFGVVTVTC